MYQGSSFGDKLPIFVMTGLFLKTFLTFCVVPHWSDFTVAFSRLYSYLCVL